MGTTCSLSLCAHGHLGDPDRSLPLAAPLTSPAPLPAAAAPLSPARQRASSFPWSSWRLRPGGRCDKAGSGSSSPSAGPRSRGARLPQPPLCQGEARRALVPLPGSGDGVTPLRGAACRAGTGAASYDWASRALISAGLAVFASMQPGFPPSPRCLGQQKCFHQNTFLSTTAHLGLKQRFFAVC